MKALKQILIVILLSLLILFIWSEYFYRPPQEPVKAFSHHSEVQASNSPASDSSVEDLLVAFKDDLQSSYPDLWTLDYDTSTGKMNVRIMVSAADFDHFHQQITYEDDFSDWYSLLGSVEDLAVAWQQKISASGHDEILSLITVYYPKTADTNQVLANLVGSKVIYDYFDGTISTSAVDSPSSLTLGQQNALKSALSYLSFTSFSWSGLVEQLEYEGYTHDEAVYAANTCGADWNEQAAKSAVSYLRYSSYSRSGLIEQLEFEGFTHDQAVYGVTQAGY